VSTCFEQPSVHPQEDLYAVLWYFFMHPYKQSGRWQDVFDIWMLKLVVHQVSLRL